MRELKSVRVILECIFRNQSSLEPTANNATSRSSGDRGRTSNPNILVRRCLSILQVFTGYSRKNDLSPGNPLEPKIYQASSCLFIKLITKVKMVQLSPVNALRIEYRR